MTPDAILGLVRSRMDYVRDWGDAFEAQEGQGAPERVFDLSSVLRDGATIETDYSRLGRHLPFPTIAIVGSGHGVIIVSGDEDGMYAYCYSAPVPMLVVRFTAIGWSYEGILRRSVGEIERVPGSDVRVKNFAEAVAQVLAFVEKACDDTRHIVSYTLNRAERRGAARDNDIAALGAVTVHRVCLDMAERMRVTASRGATVVPTPKRLHEVRAHWRHMKSGLTVRVRSHTRGKRDGADRLLPRIYSAVQPPRSSPPETPPMDQRGRT